MSTTSALELLERADILTRRLRESDALTTTEQWDTFDDTLYRLLIEIVGIEAEHVRTADPSWRALDLAIRSYPAPLRPPVDTRLLPSQAARYEDCHPDTIRWRYRRGHLHAVKEGETHLIRSSDVDARPDLRPADPTDPHPLARISCTLGAMADLVHESRSRGPAVLTRDGEAAGAVLHVLSLAAVAARHTLAHGALEEAGRPLVVGRQAERVIGAVRDVALEPISLDRLTSVAPVAQPLDLNGRLEAAIEAWRVLARQELDRLIPSVDVLRQIANQGSHLCAVRARLEPHPTSPRITELREAGEALARGERAWGTLTTLTRPSHEFVSASRELFETLRHVGLSVEAGDGSLNRGRIASDIDRGLTAVGELMTLTQSMPERLVAAGVLRGPAKSLRSSDDRLRERAQGRYVKVRPADVPELGTAWLKACTRLDRVPATPRTASVERSLL